MSNTICTITKTIEYTCGCTVILSNYTQKSAGHACVKHAKPIKKITTVEDYFDMDAMNKQIAEGEL